MSASGPGAVISASPVDVSCRRSGGPLPCRWGMSTGAQVCMGSNLRDGPAATEVAAAPRAWFGSDEHAGELQECLDRVHLAAVREGDPVGGRPGSTGPVEVGVGVRL